MKRLDLVRHLRAAGCMLDREGGHHSIFATRPMVDVLRFRGIAKSRTRWPKPYATSWESHDLNELSASQTSAELGTQGNTTCNTDHTIIDLPHTAIELAWPRWNWSWSSRS